MSKAGCFLAIVGWGGFIVSIVSLWLAGDSAKPEYGMIPAMFLLFGVLGLFGIWET